MTDSEVGRLISGAPHQVVDMLDQYMPYEMAYSDALVTGAIPLEAATTAGFPPAGSVACTSAR